MKLFLATPFILIGKICASVTQFLTCEPAQFISVAQEVSDGNLMVLSEAEFNDVDRMSQRIENADSIEEVEAIIEEHRKK